MFNQINNSRVIQSYRLTKHTIVRSFTVRPRPSAQFLQSGYWTPERRKYFKILTIAFPFMIGSGIALGQQCKYRSTIHSLTPSAVYYVSTIRLHLFMIAHMCVVCVWLVFKEDDQNLHDSIERERLRQSIEQKVRENRARQQVAQSNEPQTIELKNE